MKKTLFIYAFLLFGIALNAQDLTLTSPDGLSEPYEVTSGTEITVQWSYFETEPTYMFSFDEDPGDNLDSDWQFSTNPDWTTLSGWTDNGDGTYDLSLSISEDTWVFGAFNSFTGNSYSNVILVSIASDIVITYEDGLICSTGDTETLTVEGSYTTYQWYKDEVLIDGATSSTYDATSSGSYYAIVDDIQSNILLIEDLTIDFIGSLNVDGTEITLTADAGMDTYQWYSGQDAASMTAIVGATDAEYIATISSTLTYYSVEGVLNTCTIMSDEKPVSNIVFTPTVVMVNADTNSFNQICDGTQIILSVDESTTNFGWYRDGSDLSSNSYTYTIWGAWAEGEYYVLSSPAEWPEIEIQSNSIDVNYLELISPVLIGVDNYSDHCDGDEINITLSDEGYTYSWYQHEDYNYDESDLIEVPSNTYTFTFSGATRITVVGEFQGCQEATTMVLNSYADETPYISISNSDQQYLCTDSTAYLGLNYNTEDFTDYQWLQLNDDVWEEISGETSHSFDAEEPGSYMFTAVSAYCSSAIVESNVYEVKDYTERPMYLWANPTEICIGDTSVITFSDYNWTALQWHEAEMNIGSSGYEKEYVPIIGAGNDNTIGVTEFNSYVIKAKHSSCPNGLKITSDPVVIRPAVNPTVSIIPDVEPESWKEMLWDSAAFYLFCDDYEVTVTVEDEYDSYQWYEQVYEGIDDYVWGNPIEDATTNTHETNALVQWVTLEVEEDGCVGQSDPILLDTWAFLNPTITSYNNSELCEEGDSTLIHISFPGTWVYIEWYHNGLLVDGANDDSLYVFEEGMYTVTGYPEACPDHGYSSGVGPIITFLEATIEEGIWEDTQEEFFYALPELGYYEYQWYIDGVPYENDTNTPWILYKEDLPSGVITVEVTNPEPCTSLSDGVLWEGLSIGENAKDALSIYPNPTRGILTIEGVDLSNTSSMAIYSTLGNLVRNIEVNDELMKLDISDLPKGMYLLRIQDNNGNLNNYTINKL